MKLNYLVWMLLAMQWTFSVTTTGHGTPIDCCSKTDKNRVNVTEIVKYIHQENALCSIKAIRFILRNGLALCFDPEDAWAKHAIKYLKNKTNTKIPNIPPSWTSTSGTETNTSRSSTQPSTESTITMTTPKGSSPTWKLGTFITHGYSSKQTPGNTNKPPQTTTTQITPIKMTPSTATTTITTEGKPSTTNIETTSTSMTTENPVTMTSITLRPRTTVTHRYSTQQSTKTQITTFSVTKAISKTMTTESQMTTSMSTRTSTTLKPTSKTFKQVTPETKTSSMTTGNRMTMTAPRGTSTTETPGQKSSTSNIKPSTTRCRTKTSSATMEKKKIPWTVRRLRKKTKTGLRRAQMNLKTNMC